MGKSKVIFLLSLISVTLSAITLPFSTSLTDKHGDQYSTAKCNANTVIDFSFSSGTTLNFGSNIGSSAAAASSLRYLDILGNEIIYTMEDGQLANQQFITGLNKAFVFKFVSGTKTVFVAVPIVDPASSTTNSQLQQTVDLSKVTDIAFSNLKQINSGSATSMPLSILNILDDLTNGKFYEIMDTTSMTTLLIAKVHYKFTRTLPTSSGTNIFDNTLYTASAQDTGDVLCWGSQYNTGFFQTHLRESVSLWTYLLLILFFWLFNLLSSQVTPQVYERSFKDNKWTCWSFYSLFWLCHEEWFTRTSRSSLFLINIFWQGIVVAAIYYHQGMSSPSTIIIWAGVVAFAVSIPIPYLVGNLFFKRIYNIELQKFTTQRDLHHQLNKEKHEELQRSAILMEEHIYGIYYFYYSMVIILLAVFSVVTVHLIQQFSRDYYYLNFYWLASVGIAFGLDHLVFDPLMTLLFGNYDFYRSRGYYYQAKLGELAREAD